MPEMKTSKETKQPGGWLLLTDGDVEISQAGDDVEIIPLTPFQVVALRALLPRLPAMPAPAYAERVHETVHECKPAYGLPRPTWPVTGEPAPASVIGQCPCCGSPIVRGIYYRTRKQGGGLLRVRECWSALQQPATCTYREKE